MEDIKRSSPHRSKTDEYKTTILLKIWLRILRKILKRAVRKILSDVRLAALTLLILVVAIWEVTQLASHHANPIPAKYRKGLSFTLYYPSRLPNGYVVDQASFKRQDDVLIFSIKAPSGKNVAVSEQAVPVNLPSRQAANTPLPVPGERNFSTSIGQVHIGLWGDKYVSDIVTPQTWIILNTTGFTADRATIIVQSFKSI